MSDFTVKDRRLFDKDGNIISDEQAPSSPNADEAQKAPQKEADAKASPESDRFGAGDIEATLSTLIIGLATTAMIHLGEQSPDGSSPPQKPDLISAKHTIDILGILKTKTLGNLDQAETALLEALLYDLRMKYVQVSQGK
ncbi:MAG: DUF1844 domain-containing protein [Deltaproteobacteria bacterium]|jgi:hypothetical protein|nr:DUF1844 domain-containing protein [Deltaproteobacteria bacterium]